MLPRSHTPGSCAAEGRSSRASWGDSTGAAGLTPSGDKWLLKEAAEPRKRGDFLLCALCCASPWASLSPYMEPQASPG